MAKPADVSNLPAAYQAASNHCHRHFVTKDRGLVRRSNDRTFDTQAKEFVDWCELLCFTEHSIRELTDAQCIDVLGTYLLHVGAGWNCLKKTDLSSQSMRNYVKAAHGVLEVWLDRKISIYDPSTMGKLPRYHPFLAQQLSDRRAWTRKKPQKLPLTRAMYEALAAHLAQFGVSLDCFLGDVYAVYDWLWLGVFTGFRVSEYAQAKVSKGCQFLAIPSNYDVPEDQRGKPLAFISSDFTFFTTDLHEIPHPQVMVSHRKGLVQYVQLCWRFDKSANNFVIRRYASIPDVIFNPVDAAVNEIAHSKRWHRTSVPTYIRDGFESAHV